MKVLLINQAFYPDPVATAQHTYDLARHLTESACHVTVLSGRRSYHDRKLIYARRETLKGIDIHRVHSTGFGKLNLYTRLIDGITFDLLLIWKLIWMPRQDVVISFTSPPLVGLFGTLFCLLKGGRSIQWLMDINPDAAIAVGYLSKRSWISHLLIKVFEFSLRNSSHIVVLDRWMKLTVLAHGALEEQMVIVPPWTIDENRVLLIKSSENPFRKQYGISNKYVILYSGNHSIVHPLDTLLEVAVRLKDFEDILFLFIGSGLRVSDVNRFKTNYSLKNVMQLPYQPRELLDQSLSAADLHVVVMGDKVSGLVHTSKIYGVLSTGKPYVFIGPTRSHVADLLKECPFGFHVEHGEVDRLAQIIHQARALSEASLRKYSVENIRHVSTHFSATTLMQHFVQTAIQIPTVHCSDNTIVATPDDAITARTDRPEAVSLE